VWISAFRYGKFEQTMEHEFIKCGWLSRRPDISMKKKLDAQSGIPRFREMRFI
jgi:hypothetical protein